MLCWTGYALIGRVLLQGISPLLTTAATVAIGALMLLFLTALYEGGAFIHSLQHTPAQVWLLLAAMSFGATMLAYLWYFDGIRQLGVGTASRPTWHSCPYSASPSPPFGCTSRRTSHY